MIPIPEAPTEADPAGAALLVTLVMLAALILALMRQSNAGRNPIKKHRRTAAVKATVTSQEPPTGRLSGEQIDAARRLAQRVLAQEEKQQQ